jgi:hypothetical protein
VNVRKTTDEPEVVVTIPVINKQANTEFARLCALVHFFRKHSHISSSQQLTFAGF